MSSLCAVCKHTKRGIEFALHECDDGGCECDHHSHKTTEYILTRAQEELGQSCRGSLPGHGCVTSAGMASYFKCSCTQCSCATHARATEAFYSAMQSMIDPVDAAEARVAKAAAKVSRLERKITRKNKYVRRLKAERAACESLAGKKKSPAKPKREPCVVCLENERTNAFTICGHLCVCVKCGQDMHMCPLGRAECTSVRIYM